MALKSSWCNVMVHEKMQIIRVGQICYEPAGAIMEHLDNASDRAPAHFIPYYLLNGQKELIEMLPATLA
jgi:hypothetical protein